MPSARADHFKVAVDVAWNRRAIFSDANTPEAVELQETAPPREQRPPMRHMVARRVKFGTALLHSSYGTTASSGLVGRAPAMPEKPIPINNRAVDQPLALDPVHRFAVGTDNVHGIKFERPPATPR